MLEQHQLEFLIAASDPIRMGKAIADKACTAILAELERLCAGKSSAVTGEAVRVYRKVSKNEAARLNLQRKADKSVVAKGKKNVRMKPAQREL